MTRSRKPTRWVLPDHRTKHNYLVRDANDVGRVIHEAFYVARSGRPGPVVVDLPKDVQFAPGNYELPEDTGHRTYRPRVKGRRERDREPQST